MPLIPCPDCGREVSDAAAACIHCGHPFVPAAPAKPMAGIVTACVLGLATLAWALIPGEPPKTEIGQDLDAVSRGIHVMGPIALLCGALLSLAGQRVGNAVVRGTSRVVIVILVLTMVIVYRAAAHESVIQYNDSRPGYLIPLMAVVTLFAIAQWLLYLYLFRKSKYP